MTLLDKLLNYYHISNEDYQKLIAPHTLLDFNDGHEFDNVEEATHAMVHKTKTFYPNELAHKNYDTLYKKVYVKMYPQLKDVYRDLNKFLKRGN